MAQRETIIAVSSWCWHEGYYAGRFSLLDLPGAARAIGFGAVECNDFFLPPPRRSRVRRPLLRVAGANEELWRYSQANLEQLRGAMVKAGVSCLAWTINSDLTVGGVRWYWQGRYLEWGLRAARLLGARLLRVTLGQEKGTQGNLPSQGRGQELRGTQEVDGRVAGRLAAWVERSQVVYPGVVVVLENHWGVSTDIGRHLAIYEAAKERLGAGLRPYFGLCFDPGNMDEGDAARYWPALAEGARHVHIKCGRKAINYAKVKVLLDEAGYEGGYTIEFEGDGDVGVGVREGVGVYESVIRDA